MNKTSEDFEIVRTDADDFSIMHYTSGTTGKPKGAVHSHKAIILLLPYPLKDKESYCNILQAKSIPSFSDLNRTYFFAPSHREHTFRGSVTFTISNQFTLSSILATQNALSGHFLLLLPSMMSRNSSGVSFKSHRHCFSIPFCSSVNSLFSILFIISQSGEWSNITTSPVTGLRYINLRALP